MTFVYAFVCVMCLFASSSCANYVALILNYVALICNLNSPVKMSGPITFRMLLLPIYFDRMYVNFFDIVFLYSDFSIGYHCMKYIFVQVTPEIFDRGCVDQWLSYLSP